MDIEPEEIMYDTSDRTTNSSFCRRLISDDLPRRRLKNFCFIHQDEEKITACGSASDTKVSKLIFYFSIFFITYISCTFTKYFAMYVTSS